MNGKSKNTVIAVSVYLTTFSLVDLFFVIFFFYPMPHMSFTDFVVFPPRHGRSVTDF